MDTTASVAGSAPHPEQVTQDRFTELLLNSTPLIDVRAECEYLDGHIPNSHNLPLLTDPERAEVGTCYKKEDKMPQLLLATNSLAETSSDDESTPGSNLSLQTLQP